jgi:4-amino-4-deoxy-L-arabinose transferase-like glycosyltransferase
MLQAIKRHDIYFISLLAGVVVFLLSPVNPILVDSASYALVARSMLSGTPFVVNGTLVTDVPPFFPAVLAFFMLLFGGLFEKACLALSSFAFLVSVYLLARHFAGERAAKVGAIAAFFTPLLLFNSMLALSDVLFATIINFSMISLMRYSKSFRKTDLLAASILLGVSILTRYSIFPLVLISALLLGNGGKNKKIAGLAALLFISAAVFLPWFLFTHSVGGETLETRLVDIFLSSMKDIPLNTARIGGTILLFLNPLLLLAFAYSLFSSKNRKKYAVLLIWVILFIMSTILVPSRYGVSSRYMIPMVVPMAIIFASEAFSLKNSRHLYALLAIFFLISSLLVYYDATTRWMKYNTQVYTETGEWLYSNTDKNASILCINAPCAAISFYSERNVSAEMKNPYCVVFSNFNGTEAGASIIPVLCKSYGDGRFRADIYCISCNRLFTLPAT